MTASLAKPLLVDVSTPGSGPFAVIPLGCMGTFAVVRSDDAGKWPWFCATNRGWCVAVAAALNGMVR